MTSRPKTLIVLLGATATGKTGLGVELARRLGTEIISADSRQFYREMPIGTAAPTPDELLAAPHHLIGTRSVTEDYSCGAYETEASELIERLFVSHDTLLLVGGSGLYIDALCRGMDEMPEVDPALREQLTRRLNDEGLPALLDDLKRLDPLYHEQVDRENPQRVVRALEVSLQTGRPYSAIRGGQIKERPYRILKLGLRMPRAILYERINSRVDAMVEAGLEQEARSLYPLRNRNALQTVGYQEWFACFDGEITREQAIELIKRNSRRYAKRQETWFRRDETIHWIEVGPRTADEAQAWLKERLDFE